MKQEAEPQDAQPPESTFSFFHLWQDESDPTGFCLYGYVQALFIEFRHTVPLQEQGVGYQLAEWLSVWLYSAFHFLRIL